MSAWSKRLRYDPVGPLQQNGNEALKAVVRRDLLEEQVSKEKLWELPAALRILRKQEAGGYWKYPGAKLHVRTQEDYNQIETYRNLGLLVEMYGMDRSHPAIEKAAAYFFSVQSAAGDFRGIYGGQYSPNYTAGITELLVKAGFVHEPQIARVYNWLMSLRQLDGGWAIPLRTRKQNIGVITNTATIEPDLTRPSSYMVTGVVLRALAAHPHHVKTVATRKAAEVLHSGLFRKDPYPDRASPDFWLKFTFPFWFTDLISAMDSLSRIGYPKDAPGIQEALAWFADTQLRSGLWDLVILKGKSSDQLDLWLALCICRIFRRYFN